MSDELNRATTILRSYGTSYRGMTAASIQHDGSGRVRVRTTEGMDVHLDAQQTARVIGR